MVKENGRLFVSSVLAGMCIAMGGTVFLRLKDAFPGGNVVGALLFTVGLFVVCTRGYALFTGKACYIFDNPPAYLGKLLLIWLGNLAGTGFFALMERLTAICGTKGIDAVAEGLVAEDCQYRRVPGHPGSGVQYFYFYRCQRLCQKSP